MKLYEIAQKYEDMMDQLEAIMEENPDIPDEEAQEIITNTMVTVQDEADEKIENLASMITNLTSDVGALKMEAAKLTARAKAKQRKIDWLRGYLAVYMPRVGYEKKVFETARHRISFRTSKAVNITDPEEFLEWAEQNAPDLLKYKDPEPDKTAIKEAIKDGREIAFAQIVENRNLQIK